MTARHRSTARAEALESAGPGTRRSYDVQAAASTAPPLFCVTPATIDAGVGNRDAGEAASPTAAGAPDRYAGGGVLIVTYHAVASPASPIACPPARLEQDIVGLRDAGFTFVSLDACAEWLEGRAAIPERAVAVTFDDAYASVVTDGLPILIRHHVPATVFAIGARMGGDNQWPGQWRSIARMPLADRAGLADLAAAGIDIGSHTWSHPVLTGIDSAAAEREIVESADRLEQIVGAPVRHFAYPYGIRGPREIAIARRRYRTAVNATPRPVDSGDDRYDLHRLDCHDLALALQLHCVPAMKPYLAVRRGARQVRRFVDRLRGDL
jgi:peptidoglycan/xylan/chitin deacetylase (PgdA/CDA1 family)